MFVDPFIKPIRGLFANYITTLKTFKKKHSLLLATYDIILKDDSKDFVTYAEFGEGEDGELVKEKFQTWVAKNCLEVNLCIRIALDTKKTSFSEWFHESEKYKEPDELVLYCLGKMMNKHVTIFNDSYVWTTLSKYDKYDYHEMMEKSAVNLIYLGERDYAFLKKKGTAVCDPSPEPKTELTAKKCVTGRSRKPKNLDIRVTKKVTCRTAGKRKSTSPRDHSKKKVCTLAEARQERIPTSSFSTNNNLVSRGKRSSCKRINYLELNDGLDENPEPISPKRKRRQQQYAPLRTRPSDSRVAAHQRSTSPSRKIVSGTATLKGIQTSVPSNEIAVNTVNNTALNAVHKSVLGVQLTGPDVNPSTLGVQTTNEDTLPDFGRSSEPDIEALLLPTTTTEINSNLQKEGQSTEDELNAVDALLGLQHLRDNSIVPLEDDNSKLMPIGGGENVPEDIAPQPLLLDQVNIDNAIATMIATEQEAEINTNRNKEQAENTSTTSKGENPVEPTNNPLDGVHIADVGKMSGTSAVKNQSDGDQTNVAEGTTTEKDSDGDKIQPSHGAFKTQLHGLKRKAPVDRSYWCQLCGAHERSQQSLNNHHHLEHKAQMCGTCGKIFELATSLTHHMYSHFESKYYCEKCNYHCYFKSELKTHKIMHHTTPQHQCMYPKCGRWFMRKGDLVIHVETHRKRKFKCDDCDFETKSKKYLKEHQKVHADNLPYKCEKCGKGFKWRSSVRNHRKNAHK